MVIPAHNEQGSILDCLNAVERSRKMLKSTHAGIAVRIVVVLDSCNDATARHANNFANTHPGYSVLNVLFSNVGESRAFGVSQGIKRLPAARRGAGYWIACTDADTKVPGQWLGEFVAAYQNGADAVTGTVEPDRSELPTRLYRRWRKRYTLAPRHRHIHGANLGISAETYFRIGGFRPLATHEDVELVSRIRRSGYRVDATDRLHAITSGRLQGRVNSGFADYLSALADEDHPAAPSSPGAIRTI